MDETVPSLTTDGVGSRFVSQNELEVAKARRDEQWRAAYARLGQEPPPQPAEDVWDGRSLAEKLAANRAAKQEEWEERNKLGNQFRALEEDEIQFLDAVLEKQREEERKRKEMDGEEVKAFREAVAARERAADRAAVAPLDPSPPAVPAKDKGKAAAAQPARKEIKKSLKGVLVKKKTKASPPESKTGAAPQTQDVSEDKREGETGGKRSGDPKTADEDAPQNTKRRRISEAAGA
ncbi:hypothetical protein OBBRIDRAFT_883710 [Obba rivulosa]|uniref:FAM192A/Fyv6 N-terminal domain-containing protein n=1 Tax=Obba rivulosa TaxID=1052685 RepID=A0A8E2DTX6_9APHY|nr:hypothetical protein OBBRIDRAFT_883710 [Obba rivulosa]